MRALIPITPVTAETCARYVGKSVCAVMQDGSRYYGILRGVGDGQLYLEGTPEELALHSLKGRTKSKRKPAAKANTKAFGYGPGYGYGYGFGFGVFALSLALLASLFFIPFFFI